MCLFELFNPFNAVNPPCLYYYTILRTRAAWFFFYILFNNFLPRSLLILHSVLGCAANAVKFNLWNLFKKFECLFYRIQFRYFSFKYSIIFLRSLLCSFWRRFSFFERTVFLVLKLIFRRCLYFSMFLIKLSFWNIVFTLHIILLSGFFTTSGQIILYFVYFISNSPNRSHYFDTRPIYAS